MAQLETWYKQDLKKPLVVHRHADVFNQDSRGNLIGVEIYSDGEPVTLSGSIDGYCLLSDGTTVSAVGANRTGNKASILIPQTAYNVPGPITITIKNTDGNDITTLCAVVGLVRQSVSGNLVQPGDIVTDWSQSINSQLQAVQDAADNVGAIVAAPFAENTAYVVGNYVTYNGNLYRITADHAAGVTWANTSKKQCTVGTELYDLKSALLAQFNEATAYSAGSYVYYGASMYRLQKDHAAGETWANTSKSKVTLNDIRRFRQSIAGEYDPTATYAVGDYCAYNGIFYRCTTAITTSEAFNASHWAVIYLAKDILERANQSVTDFQTAWIATFDTQTEYAAGSYVYYNGSLYRLQKTHTVGMSWANTTKAKVTINDIRRFRQAVAAEYDPSATYNVGDYACYNGIFYKCAVPITTAEAFNASHWTVIYLAKDLAKGQEYTVGTGQQYTTLHDCLTALKGNTTEKTIHIYGGYYDILEEMGGSEFLASLTGSEAWYDVCDMIPQNTHVIGHGNVVINLTIPSGTPTNVAGLLSPINMNKSCSIENLTINCDGGRYCVHAEGSQLSENDNAVWRISNCKMTKTNNISGVQNVIGVGMNNGNLLEITNCIIINDGNAGLLVHDQQTTSGLLYESPKIFVSGCAFDVAYYPCVWSTTHSGATSGAILEATVANCFVNNKFMRKIGANKKDVFRVTYINTPHRTQNESGIVDLIPDTDYNNFALGS